MTMQSKNGRYYLSRVIKLGLLTQDKLISAILNAPVLPIGKFEWAITDVHDGQTEPTPFVFGKLAKYSREWHVTVVDPDRKSQVEAIAPNLLVASAPFVYLPEFSGLAFLHVWNGIQEELFPKRFSSLIQAAYHDFFVECSVEPVADYRAFAEKIEGLDRIKELSAKVHPPNPLFGHLWASLKDYLKMRNASEVAIKESEVDQQGLHSSLAELLRKILENPNYQPTETPAMTDAALLMAADGYGRGKVIGVDGNVDVVIRTSDTQKSFLFRKEPFPPDLAREAARNFSRISDERGMTH